MGSTNPIYTLSSSTYPPPPLLSRPNDREGENYADQVGNTVEEYVQFLDINSMVKINTRPMPITSHTVLPHTKLASFSSSYNNNEYQHVI